MNKYKLATWSPESTGSWPFRCNVFIAKDKDTGKTIYYNDKQGSAEGNQSYVDQMMMQVNNQGYAFSEQTIRAIHTEYKLEMPGMSSLIVFGMDVAKKI